MSLAVAPRVGYVVAQPRNTECRYGHGAENYTRRANGFPFCRVCRAGVRAVLRAGHRRAVDGGTGAGRDGGVVAAVTGPACAHCGAPDPIRGEGTLTLTCARCVASLARVAGDPASAHPDVLARLMERSLDVVHLDTRIEVDDRDPWATPTVSPVWEWTRTWATDDRLITGKRALP